MDSTYKLIINDIRKIYDKYEKVANEKNEEAKSKQTSGPDKNEKQFLSKIDTVKQSLVTFTKGMEASKALQQGNEMKRYIKVAIDSQKYIENVLKKKNNFLFKINKSILELVNNTVDVLAKCTKQLPQLEKQDKGAWFCCGKQTKKTDIFRDLIGQYRECAANWRFMIEIEPKSSSDTYISPPFNEKEFGFIKQVLVKNWPNQSKIPQKPTQVIVQKKVQVIKEVVKYIQNGKPNRLSIANQWIYGINRQINPMIGLQIYHEQADKNQNGNACSYLGKIYEEGLLLNKDYNKAVYYYKKANSLKDPYGTYLYAKSLENGILRQNFRPTKEDLTLAFNLLKTSAQSNCLEAMVDIGHVYENGHFQQPNHEIFTINKDLKKALNLYQKARNEKSPKASNNLGVFYIKNKYVDENNPNNVIKNQANLNKNMKLALQYLHQSANRGFATAYYNLGTLYERGQATDQDLERAKDYFHEGATKGDNKCKIFYSFYLIDQTSIYRESFQQEYKLAIRWLEDVITASTKLEQIEKAYYYLGLYYQYGFGVDPKPKKAVQYYQKAAYIEFPPAINRLGHCYYSGFGVKADKTIAIGYYKQAAQKGNDQAMVNLGSAYMSGINNTLDKNLALAYQYFESAMKMGNTDAYVHLSQMYELGLYVKKDDKLAKQLLNIAAIKKNQNAIYMLNQRNLPIDEQILLNIENQMFIPPKTINLNETIPYIKDLHKASMIR